MDRFCFLVLIFFGVVNPSGGFTTIPDIKIPNIKKIKSKPTSFLGTLSDYRRYLIAIITWAKMHGADFRGVPPPLEDKIEEWFIRLEQTILETFLDSPKIQSVSIVFRIYCPIKSLNEELSKLSSWVMASKYAMQHDLETDFIELTDEQFEQITEIRDNPNLYYKIEKRQVQDRTVLDYKKMRISQIVSDFGPGV